MEQQSARQATRYNDRWGVVVLSPCPDCGLRPRYLVDGKWSTVEMVIAMRLPTNRFSVRTQHARWCPSEYNRLRRSIRYAR